MSDPKEYAEMQNVTEEECFERWDGVDWKSSDDGTDRGTCFSDTDFDGWAAEHEGGKESE